MALLIRKLYLALIFALLGAAVPLGATADDNIQLAEQKIKVGLLYNFLKYTDWPTASFAGESSPMVVCIFGDDPFGGSIQPMQGRSVNQREITLRMLHDTSEVASCNLLFVTAEEQGNWPKLRDALAGKSVLTVSDFDGFAKSGGMIEFGLKNNRIEARLNIEAVKDAHLNVSDRLLKLVTIMKWGQ